MAHGRKQLAPGWERDGQDSHARGERRKWFLRAVFEAKPALATECHDLAPLMKSARDHVVGPPSQWALPSREIVGAAGELVTVEFPTEEAAPFMSWHQLTLEAARVKHGVSRLPAEAQHAVSVAHDALLAWTETNHLQASAKHRAANFGEDWLLSDLWRILLCSDGSTLPLGFGEVSGHVPILPGSNDFALQIPGWNGYTSSTDWIRETLAKVRRDLQSHIAETEGYLAKQGYSPIKVQKRAGLKYVELAARWQVLNQSWSDFLLTETKPDGTEHDPRKLRSNVLEALSYVGIQERPGMKSTQGTAD